MKLYLCVACGQWFPHKSNFVNIRTCGVCTILPTDTQHHLPLNSKYWEKIAIGQLAGGVF